MQQTPENFKALISRSSSDGMNKSYYDAWGIGTSMVFLLYKMALCGCRFAMAYRVGLRAKLSQGPSILTHRRLCGCLARSWPTPFFCPFGL